MKIIMDQGKTTGSHILQKAWKVALHELFVINIFFRETFKNFTLGVIGDESFELWIFLEIRKISKFYCYIKALLLISAFKFDLESFWTFPYTFVW